MDLMYNEKTGKWEMRKDPIELTMEFETEEERDAFIEFTKTKEFREPYEKFTGKRHEDKNK